MIKSNSLRHKIIENYDEHGFKKMQWVELARINNTTEKYILRLVRDLRDKNLLPETPEARARRQKRSIEAKLKHMANSVAKTPLVPAQKPALDGIANLSGALSREQRIAILSDIAERGQDISKIQAITRLEEMERAAGIKFGPPPPTTEAEVVTLVVEMLSSLNPEWVETAIKAYHEQAKPNLPHPQTPSEGSDDPSASAMGGRDEGH